MYIFIGSFLMHTLSKLGISFLCFWQLSEKVVYLILKINRQHGKYLQTSTSLTVHFSDT